MDHYYILLFYFKIKTRLKTIFVDIFFTFADYPRIRLSADAAPPNSADNREFTVYAFELAFEIQVLKCN